MPKPPSQSRVDALYASKERAYKRFVKALETCGPDSPEERKAQAAFVAARNRYEIAAARRYPVRRRVA